MVRCVDRTGHPDRADGGDQCDNAGNASRKKGEIHREALVQ